MNQVEYLHPRSQETREEEEEKPRHHFRVPVTLRSPLIANERRKGLEKRGVIWTVPLRKGKFPKVATEDNAFFSQMAWIRNQ